MAKHYGEILFFCGKSLFEYKVLHSVIKCYTVLLIDNLIINIYNFDYHKSSSHIILYVCKKQIR